MPRSHNAIVDQQFGPRAQAYVASPTHAAGPDLDRLEAVAREGSFTRALDLGCGGGHAGYRIAPHVGELVACDLSQNMLDAVADEAARRSLGNLTTRQAAAEQLPFADAAFDLLVCRLSAHHWQDLAAGLREARRVLVKGSPAVIIDVVSPGGPAADTHLQAIEVLRDESHVRDYAIGEWCGALVAAGFDIRRILTHRLPITFQPWIDRMQTPPAQVEAIRSLQRGASQAVREAFEIGEDGDFSLAAASFELIAG